MQLTAPHLIRTKIIPPPRRARTLARPRVVQQLAQALDYRLTVLQAGAGYGKSTALAELAAELHPLIWCQVSDEDADPLVLLLHLCHAIHHALPAVDGLPTAVIEAWDGGQAPLPWRRMLDQTINALSEGVTTPTLLVIDDAHQILQNNDVTALLDRLVALAPAHLHILMAGRPTISLPGLPRWRAHGQALLLDQSALTFTLDEITTLFTAHYGIALTVTEADALLAYTEGWAIALQLIWQNWRRQTHTPVAVPRHWQAASLDALFELLALEVFASQPAAVQAFLLLTSTLRDLAPDACDALCTATGYTGDGAAMLAYLRRHDLFVTETAEGVLRYHHIFHSFLRQQSPRAQRIQWHQIAADFFLGRNELEAALYHLLEAQEWAAVAQVLDTYGARLLAAGRLDTLAAYIDALPPETLHQHPGILFLLGELARLRSRFDEALGWHRQAESLWRLRGQQEGIARALRGQARVYLDTVDPSQAAALLEEAIRLSDGFEDREAQIRLFELLAENKLNAGHVEEAERLRQRAEALRLEGPANEELWFRVLLRTGRLHEARQALESRVQLERTTPVQTPRAHRETLLLLSLICALQGEADAAYRHAVEGTSRGQALNSPFITAVGYMRQGHALMLLGDYRTRTEQYTLARQQYARSIEISKQLAVPRLRVEAGWGACRAYGFAGEITTAATYADESIAIARQAGDEWIASLIRLTFGASLVLAGDYAQAEPWLSMAIAGFQECSDPFGRSAARLWLALLYYRQRQMDRLAQVLPDLLLTCQRHEYAFLWTRPSLVGAPEVRVFTPLLLLAVRNGWEAEYAMRLLDDLGLARVEIHPGYQLRVQTLGGFQVWRGDTPIPANGWRRKAARQLFQLLITYRRAPLERDQICEALWPEVDPVTAQQNFKIALNALYQVLEPLRSPGAESAYVLRDGATYSIRPNADLWIDADHFLSAVKTARESEALRQALTLYHGEYLPDARYDAWAAGERERLAAAFLESADRLVQALSAQARHTEAIDLCQRILSQDNCWERAYRNLMISYQMLGDRGQMARTYQRCVQVLREELDVDPAPETEALYRQLTMQPG